MVLEGGKEQGKKQQEQKEKKRPEAPLALLKPLAADPVPTLLGETTGMLEFIAHTEEPRRRLLSLRGLWVYGKASQLSAKKVLKRGIMMDRKVE